MINLFWILVIVLELLAFFMALYLTNPYKIQPKHRKD